MYIHYDDTTGKIYGCMKVPITTLADNIALLPENTSLIEWPDRVDDSLYYFDGVNSFILRPTINANANKVEILADGNDLFILSNLPNICTVTVEDKNIETENIVTEIDDGEFGFYTRLVGEYTVTVESFPYITKSWVVNAI